MLFSNKVVGKVDRRIINCFDVNFQNFLMDLWDNDLYLKQQDTEVLQNMVRNSPYFIAFLQLYPNATRLLIASIEGIIADLRRVKSGCGCIPYALDVRENTIMYKDSLTNT